MRISIELGNLSKLKPYRLLPLALMLWPAGNAAADRVIGHYRLRTDVVAEEGATYLSEGDVVAGYKVTSRYDRQRVHPVDGTQQPHYGVDVATPSGTKLLAPEDIVVGCWWDANGGGLVAEVVTAEGENLRLLHLSYCTKGNYRQGQPFALTGATGKGTGEHLDVRRQDKAEPTKEEIEPFLTGQPARPSLSDRELVCAIGAAEGTRDNNCQPNEHYTGHTDPGNGKANLGTFSYQHGARSPDEADQKQLARLRRAEATIQSQAEQKFDRPLSRAATAAALDLWNQSPEAGEDFVRHLPSATPTNEQTIAARSAAYVDPQTGRLDAPGLGDRRAVRADQQRRTSAVEQSLQQRRLKQLEK